jgi:hypothetical protein
MMSRHPQTRDLLHHQVLESHWYKSGTERIQGKYRRSLPLKQLQASDISMLFGTSD